MQHNSVSLLALNIPTNHDCCESELVWKQSLSVWCTTLIANTRTSSSLNIWRISTSLLLFFTLFHKVYLGQKGETGIAGEVLMIDLRVKQEIWATMMLSVADGLIKTPEELVALKMIWEGIWVRKVVLRKYKRHVMTGWREKKNGILEEIARWLFLWNLSISHYSIWAIKWRSKQDWIRLGSMRLGVKG